MIITYVTKKGITHDRSQDVVLINEEVISDYAGVKETRLRQVAIADGVGGVPGGYEAAEFLLKSFAKRKDSAEIEELKLYLQQLNSELIEYASKDDSKRAMATTFTGLCVLGQKLVVMHAGNTRLYASTSKGLMRITTDQTNYQAMVVDGHLSDEENDYGKNTIYCCFGTGNPEYLNALYVEELIMDEIPDFMFLSSDGIHDYIDDDKIDEIFRVNYDDRNKILSLMKCARKNGSEDDMSVIILRNN